MRFDYNHAENAARIGLALALVAVLLNVLSLYLVPGHRALDVFGVVTAVISMFAAYLGESAGHHHPGYNKLAFACFAFCALSYITWLVGI
jgi:hypothetical protein